MTSDGLRCGGRERSARISRRCIGRDKRRSDWVRQYWGIENGLHYRRDVTRHEDQTRFSLPNLAKSMAAINNFVIGLVGKLGLTNLAQTRRQFAYQIASQLMA